MDWMDLLGWTNWTVSVVCCLFLTSVTGSVLFVFWYVLGRWLEKAGFINILYALMKFLMLFFTVPVLYVTMSRLDSEYGIYRGRLFEYTGTIIAVCDILLLLWVAGACYILYRNLRLMRQSRKMYENSFPCEQHKEEMFWRVKKIWGYGKEQLSCCSLSICRRRCSGGGGTASGGYPACSGVFR